jgi:hypothetical protein
MGLKAGALLWNRMRLQIPGAGTLDVDTGLAQVNKSFADMSPGEPGFDDPSRIMVIPMAQIGAWVDVTHGEPYFDPATQTIHVEFSNAGIGTANINALFWNPHSLVGPGSAELYND